MYLAVLHIQSLLHLFIRSYDSSITLESLLVVHTINAIISTHALKIILSCLLLES